MRIFFFSVIIVFCLFCGWLVVESGLFDFSGQQQGCILLQNTAAEQEQSDVNTPQVEQPKMTSSMKTVYGADNSTAETVVIGAKDPNTEDPELGFKFQLELSTKGAAVRSATFSNGNGKGFDNRDPNNPMPLKVIMPVKMPNGSEILSMANTGFVFIDDGVRLPLDRLQWKNLGVKKDAEGNESASFEAVIKVKDTDEPVVKLTKTYTVKPGNYMLDCNIVVENLADIEKKIRFDMTGPGGFAREDFTTDMRKVIAGFRGTKGDILSVRYDQKKLSKAESVKERELKTEDVGPKFLWTATVNKYFAAIVVPLPDQSMDFCNWMPGR
ncbi:MAG: YidC/Oxa1 family insertase periplasmic-domain containing protein, partial [Sedimentisphaerales bacterium]|nr:YidC/Oxa1 family insertase periplasmic-domain containing protein [Sedimentisphaerales bacterium]